MLDTYDLVKYVAACADSADVSVQWIEPDGVPHCDGKTIFVPQPHAKMTYEDVVLFKRSIAHETSHVKYTDFSVFKHVPLNPLEKLVLNAIEDHRIDYHNDTKYSGDAHITAEQTRLTVNKIVQDPSEVLKNKVGPLFAWEVEERKHMPLHEVIASSVEGVLSEQGHTIMDKLRKLTPELRAVTSIEGKFEGTYACAALAKRIVKEVYEEDVEDMPPPEEVQSKGEGGSGDGGEGEEPAKGEEGKEDGDGDSVDTGGLYHDHDEKGTVPDETDKEKRGGKGSYGKGVGYVPDPNTEVLDYTKVQPEPWRDARIHIKAGLSNKVRTLLQIATRNRTVYAQKKGKLNNSSLHRIPVGVDGYSDRVFKHRVINKSLDTAVTLLVDCSGSMSGSRIEHAAAAAAMMNNVMNNVLHVNTEVLGFTEWGDKHVMAHVKTFDGPKQSPETIADKFQMVRMSDNADGESLMYAYNRIKNRKEARKIIFVLSDGSPCGGFSRGNIITYTKDVIRFIEHSKVELYAIGIQYDCSKYYTHHSRIDDTKNLEAHLLNVLKNTLI